MSGKDGDGINRILLYLIEYQKIKMKVCQKAHLLFLAQSPDFHKQGLCYYLKILYL